MSSIKYYITTLPGMEEIAKRELEEKFPRVKVDGSCTARSNSLLCFEFDGNVEDLFKIGTAEDLYCLIAVADLTGEEQDLELLKKIILDSPVFDNALI